ncbi:MAG TPA: hypothetical protein VKA91_04365 [Nitrososphaeraceae archaeon]|nr:hypothetical protein [Nitrososphaeraceae archaeon]
MQSLPISIFPIHSKPFGYTYGEWSAIWWQWLLSIPKSKNPALDSTGANAHINQNYPNVFFLCQTYQEGVPPIPNRTVTVPASRSIFMPIINWISIMHNDGETEQESIEIANKRMDVVASLQISINELTVKNGLEKYRAQSAFFEIALPEDNILALSSGLIRAISDGYWLFFKPLEGDTKISSFGSCSSGATRIGVSYNLSIEHT